MSSEDNGFKERLNPFGSAIGAKPTFKAAEYADLKSNNAQLRAQLSALEAENARLKREVSHWQGLAVTNRKVADDALAQHQRITSAMTAEVERLIDSVIFLGGELARIKEDRDALRAELAAVKGQEAVGEIVQTDSAGGRYSSNTMRSLPIGTKLYTTPPASPDVDGLLRRLCDPEKGGIDDYWRENEGAELMAEIDNALSTWRQSHP